MTSTKWILPDGIDDILPEQAYWLEIKRREVIDTFFKYGYGLVIPPLIEYSDSLLNNISKDLDLQTIKFTDQETGKQLALRADITSQISRICSTYNYNQKINRYCYFDNVVRAKNTDSKKSRIPIQAGAELIGNFEINNDIEIVNLMIDVVKKFTKKKIFLDIGHVGIFKKLISNIKLDNEKEKKIKSLIRSKSSSEIKKYLNLLDINEDIKNCLSDFPKMHGNVDNIKTHSEILKVFDKNIDNDINYIIQLCKNISKSHQDVEIKYDFCELQGFDYENDVIFCAYIENVSDEVAIGGRYDCDGKQGIGFSADIRYLINCQKFKNKISNKSGKWVIED
jgi:ATP phosphoribosyltransferase regulatory subunit